MAALTAGRNTVKMGENACIDLLELGIKASTKIWAGSLVVVDAGYIAPGRAATGLRAVGRAESTKDNTAGGAGAVKVSIRRGVFRWNNSSAGDLIALADLLTTCYIVDDQTVAKTDGGGTRSIAGRVMGVDSVGVWVETL